MLDGVERQPARVWDRVRGLNPMLDSFQVFSPQFEELYAGGRTEHAPLAAPGRGGPGGPGGAESIGGTSFLRLRMSYATPGTGESPVAESSPGERGVPLAYTVIIGASLPVGFDRAAGRLTEALEFFIQLDRFQGNFVTAIGLFYGFFSVPLILLGLLVSFLLSEEIMRPIVSLEEATRRVAEGDFSTRILVRRGDELSMLVNSFNRMVGELERRARRSSRPRRSPRGRKSRSGSRTR